MKTSRLVSLFLFLTSGFFLLTFMAGSRAAHAQTSTATALTVSPACLQSGCVTTLTATVTAGTVAVSPGLVVFCDGSAANCESGLPLGRAQLMANGTATLKLTLSPGAHTLRAIFHGTKTDSGSASTTQSLTVAPTAAGRVTSLNAQANAFEGGYSFSVPFLNSLGPIAPTGVVSFIDTSRNNTVLATATVGSTQFYNNGFDTVPADVSKVPSGLLTSAVSAISGDFNNDGIEDVAEMDANNVLTVLLGNGSGGFTQAPTYSGNTGASGPMLVGDFNGDGKLDIAIPDAASKTVHVALGKGDGTFTFAAPTALTDSPQFLSLADLNGDGIPDLVALIALSPSGNSVHVLLGVGDGTFTSLAPVTFQGDTVKSIVISDFNRDGIQDLAVADSTASKIMVFGGIGDGTFHTTPAVSISHKAAYLATGDFDGDGIPDLASGADTLAFFHGNGDLTFTLQGVEVNNVQFSGPLITGDFDGGGLLEVGYPTPSNHSQYDGLFYDFPYSPKYHSFADYALNVYSTSELFSTEAIGDYTGAGYDSIVAFDTSQGKITDFNGYLVDESSAASYRKLTFDAGEHNIVAMYGGDATHDASVSDPVGIFGSSIDDYPGFTSTSALSLNGSATLQGQSIQLTDGKPFESASFFNTSRLPWAGFQTSFDFQLSNATADGFAFVLQSNGPDAIGSSGGGLGYGNTPGASGKSITNSIAIAFDLHDDQGEGSNSLRLEYNGVTSPAGAIDLTPYGIDLHSGDRFNVVIQDYASNSGSFLDILVADLATKKSAQLELTIPSAKTLGDMAYAGFTAGTGTGAATQTIFDWTFTLAQPQPAPLYPPHPPPAFSTGFAGTGLLTFNGGSMVNGNALQLTSGTSYERTSTYFTRKLGPGYGFSTDFDFDLGNGMGDGFTFVIQNGHIGSLGSSGGGLGYGPDSPGAEGYSIGDSTAIKFDIHNNNGEGVNSTGIYMNGASPTTPSVDITPSGLNLHSGHTFHAHISYMPAVSQAITLTITDLSVYEVFQTTFPANSHNLQTLPLAFVGFTAGTGATTSSIKILNWTFTNFDQ